MNNHTNIEKCLLKLAHKLHSLANSIENYIDDVQILVVPYATDIGPTTRKYYINPETFYDYRTVEFIIAQNKKSSSINETADRCGCDVEDLQKILEVNGR